MNNILSSLLSYYTFLTIQQRKQISPSLRTAQTTFPYIINTQNVKCQNAHSSYSYRNTAGILS